MVGAHGQDSSQGPTFFDADPEFGLDTERLEAIPRVEPERSKLNETTEQPKEAVAPSDESGGEATDPGLVVVLEHCAPQYRDLHVAPVIAPANFEVDTVMTDQSEGGDATETPDIKREPDVQRHADPGTFDQKSAVCQSVNIDPHGELREKASAGLAAAYGGDDDVEAMSEKRHDSHQEQEPPLPPDKASLGSRRGSPLPKIDTCHEPAPEESITTSPNLGKHVIRAGDRLETLPAFQHNSPVKDGGAGSPRGATLPSIHQVVPAQQFRQLDELAEVATQQQDARYAHHHSPSFGSATAQSPVLPYHPYPGFAHMSPSSQQAYTARSPNGGFGDPYGSPTQYSSTVAYYNPRRSSAPTDHAPAPLTSIPSVSSSGESHGTASSADGYSTAHTTPIDVVDGTPRPMLPPPPGMVISPGYKCDVPDCPAPPFQTQYLLSSHKNVHTNERPHYCPMKDCPRGVGGKGFKRKNEMIRHGLVHESPGYVCPFCPDREHRYPRPDNLQRHVRVHHVDKDRDDPELRAVLAQRSQGSGKTRRRRANTGGSGS